MQNLTVTDAPAQGLRFERHFSEEGKDPYESVRWKTTRATIKDESGRVMFEQDGVEVPEGYSEVSTNVVVSKYFYGDPAKSLPDGRPERESSVRQLVRRVGRTVADWGHLGGYFASREDGERFHDELVVLLLTQRAAFNSPVWFNAGLYHEYGIRSSSRAWRCDAAAGVVKVGPGEAYRYPQCSACFIQSVDDDMESIMALATSEAMLFKYGSGTGTDLSTLRSNREKVNGGGRASGPVSFMEIYDAIAATVKSGGKTRRAAKLQSLKARHPDILEFIEAKTKEEKKAQTLIRGGYSANFNAEAYSSVRFQNCNMSVRATDEFLCAAERGEPWQTYTVVDGRPDDMPCYNAGELLDKIALGTWACGDPGLQYEDTIQRWHTCPNTAPINASNPCSEYMFIDDSACNLASLNLMKFRRPDGSFDIESFRAACRVMITAQEILVDNGSYPTEKIARNSHRFRPLGLGYCNVGALIMSMGLPYDSDAGRATAAALAAILTGQGYLTSAHHAANLGVFDGFAENREPMLRVMRMHRDATENIPAGADPTLIAAAREVWDEAVAAGYEHGYRNSQISVLAPTGTIAFLMGADTTGIEPDIALVKYKQLAGGGSLTLVNGTVPLALETLGYDMQAVGRILAHLKEHSTIETAPDLRPEHLAVFDCAFVPTGGTRSICFSGHLKMLGAVQPFISGAISKTCNMPRTATVADIRGAYLEGWRVGAKAVAIYRDGSKDSQPVTTQSVDGLRADGETLQATRDAYEAELTELRSQLTDLEERLKGRPTPYRRRLPDTRRSVTHKFEVDGAEGYVTAGLFEDGQLGEVFITMAKEGSTVGGLMDVVGTTVSMGLQYGVPLEVFVRKFAYTRFEPSGFTKNPDIPLAKSLADYIFQWLGMEFIPGYREDHAPRRDHDEPEPTSASPQSNGVTVAVNGFHGNGQTPVALLKSTRRATAQLTGPPCDVCCSIMVPSGSRCYRCPNCGNPGPCG
jgi:ribonucleoside-diphosphate reductase alpha chain